MSSIKKSGRAANSLGISEDSGSIDLEGK